MSLPPQGTVTTSQRHSPTELGSAGLDRTGKAASLLGPGLGLGLGCMRRGGSRARRPRPQRDRQADCSPHPYPTPNIQQRF